MGCGSSKTDMRAASQSSSSTKTSSTKTSSSPTKKGPLSNKKNNNAEAQLATALRSKRANVFAETIDESIEVVVTEAMRKDAATTSFLSKALKGNHLLSELFTEDKEGLERVVALMERRPPVEAGTTLIRQGDRGDFAYVVEDGAFEYSIDGAKVGDPATAGECFGELALLYGAPRAATVTATAKAVVWSLDRATFRSTVARTAATSRRQIVESLTKVKILKDLTEDQFDAVADAVQVTRYERGTRIIEKGDRGDVFYMIQSGEVDCTDVGSGGSSVKSGVKSVKDDTHTVMQDLALGEGEYFGERALLTDQKRAANVTARTDVVLLALDREAFQKILGPLRKVLAHNLSLRVLASVELFATLSPNERKQAAELFTERTYVNKSDLIVKEGDPGDEFFILKSGTVSVRTGGGGGNVVKKLEAGDYFGEMALLHDDDQRKASVVAETDGVETFVLTRADFVKTFGDLKAIMAREAGRRSNELRQLREEESSAAAGGAAMLAKNVTLKDLKVVANLGSGTFGRVKLVAHKKGSQGGKTSTGDDDASPSPRSSSSSSTRGVAGKNDDATSARPPPKFFALKTMHKDEVVAHAQVANVLNEKKVMALVSHPFVLRLFATFQDRYFLYLLLEFCQGGELFSVLHTTKSDGVPEPNGKFYAACVASALAALHDKSIAYRDLKPENVMIDAGGYAKIVDFGFAKVVHRKTYTLCGYASSYLFSDDVRRASFLPKKKKGHSSVFLL